ncbi:MAG TPA: sugar phosphate nucleotidyltransferase, partial [Solimonas sp.]|nr:sugar phosphate nucleotidyltransferase [Solimonas sp.]
MSLRIRKAVFPVAGLGTRFLPATKTVPKEMLPVVDKPLIQYAVDEAIEAGCETLVFVTNRYKHSVADYFDKAYELEHKLEQSGKEELLSLVRDVLPPKVRAV